MDSQSESFGFSMKKDKAPWYSEYMPSCPKCKSTRIEPLNIYKGTYKKHISGVKAELLGLNPDELKNQQQHQCKNCGKKFWKNEGIL